MMNWLEDTSLRRQRSLGSALDPFKLQWEEVPEKYEIKLPRINKQWLIAFIGVVLLGSIR